LSLERIPDTHVKYTRAHPLTAGNEKLGETVSVPQKWVRFTDPIAKILFDYLSDVISNPTYSELELEKLPVGFRDLGQRLRYVIRCVLEVRDLARALSKGNLHGSWPSRDNRMVDSLKALHASLSHLTWQTQEVAKGDYQQRVEFMGDFSEAFNTMIEQLNQRNGILLKAMAEAEAASKSKSDFLATMSHEIRTPLNAIIGLSEIQLQKQLPADTRADLEKIYNSGKTLLSIINDILDISKIEAGGFGLNPVDYDVPGLVNDAVQLNIVRIGSKKIVFDLEIDETIPVKLHGDELRVKQILNNLLSNAFKYTKEGGVALKIRWERQEDDAWVIILVSDTGIGIKKENMEKLFSEYGQLDLQANRHIEGTGLGLSITKTLVALMGGTITAESEYNAGSTFKAVIRQQIVDETPIGRETVETLKRLRFARDNRDKNRDFVRTYMPYGRVLIVDDIATTLDVAMGLMTPYGLTVDCAAGGREAVEKIKAAGSGNFAPQYDVVFMDHVMPEMDGIEATRIIRGEIGTEYARTVPIIALTANALVGNEEMFLSCGFNAFLSKPINVAHLDAVLNKWVRDRQSEKILSKTKEKAKEKEEEAGEMFKNGRELEEEEPAVFGVPSGTVPEGLDFQEGIRRFGNAAAYLQVLRSYATHTPVLLQRLRDVIEDDLTEYSIAVHGLKGSSYGICAYDIGKRAEALEFAAKAKDRQTLRADHGALLERAEALLADLKKLLKDTAEPDLRKKTAPKPDAELLEKMLWAVRRFDMRSLEDTLSKLEQCRYESEGELVEWLREQVDNLEYEAVQKRLEDRVVPKTPSPPEGPPPELESF
jgi:signal transduction histidine kinase/DNA-binding response OmpR family regulator